MMSQQIIAELRELWSRVEIAREEWHTYIDSSRYGVSQDTSTTVTETSIAARFNKIESMVTPLELRLQVLVDLKATRLQTLGNAAQIVSQRLPTHALGPETANSMLLRAFNAAEQFFFDDLRKNYDTVMRLIETAASYIDPALQLREAEALVEELVASHPELLEDEHYHKLSEIMDKGFLHGDLAIGIVERSVLKFKANIAFVGVRVARQRLITEFLVN